MELHIKIKHNEKVCCAHDLGSYAQGQGRSQVRGQNRVSIFVVALLFYVHGKHLRSCRDGQLT